MSLQTNSFEFEEFRLIPEKKILLRHGELVSITPKTFRLLLELVKNYGHPVSKNDLMKAVWADSFVEEGNLTFTINLLRKTLGDVKENPRFIETIPKFGYRFVAEVRENFAPPQSVKVDNENPFFSNKLWFISAALILFIVSITGSIWYRTDKIDSVAPILSQPFALENLSVNSKVMIAAISADGKYVVYTDEINGKQSVWLRQLETGNNVEILPPSDGFIFGLALSPTNDFLYFNRIIERSNGQGDIFRVSIFGGVPEKIISQTQGWISISPNGTKISFVRCSRQNDENCSLWIADSVDGKNEQKLVTRPNPLRIGANKFSDDGKTIVFAAGQSQNQANDFALHEVEIESGREREISEKFFNIKDLAFLPQQAGWLITALKSGENHFRIWQISANGEAKPITKDSKIYSALSLDNKAAQLVSTQVRRESWLTLLELENPDNRKIFPNVDTAGFAPDGKLIITSGKTGNFDIWSIHPDGSDSRQLTHNQWQKLDPVISPDNARIYFASNQTGETQIWSINRDGTNQTPITRKDGGFPFFVSADGEWIYYRHSIQRNLWRVAANTGEQEIVFDQEKYSFAISPDSSQIAFSDKKNGERMISVYGLNDKKIIKTFYPADKTAGILELDWMPDGEHLAYLSADKNFKKQSLWIHPLDGNPRKITEFSEGLFAQLVISPDGKTVAIGQGKWHYDGVLLKGLK